MTDNDDGDDDDDDDDNDDECEAGDRMRVKGNRNTLRRFVPSCILQNLSHVTVTGFEPRIPSWESGDYLPKIRHCHCSPLMSIP
jgi:hypothetical protein